ncbi:hypothetical protein HOT29_gp088 [Microbacterium phage Squash]|uniref:Uncharacterized protein n=1 Tax=Microbacterium phage Squash TaxID=2182357 RepID=A0A2U8UMQ3_9CAUD|nr:hypothetical protein HOT29_gp088 [Microbacterium phage Squash]AWN04706.1 hypothetical protein PBI_SQUASH_88 [Microbacterium phage Squash]
MSAKWTKTPKVGAWALHVGGHLDSREVVEVSKNKRAIKLRIGTLVTDWLPASNYEYREDS